ncbi:hypothetical protein HMPREF1549_03445 [Actinomyces johnsonii F0510]|uniref:Uncharacterized protein n=1 Tax=Actinomyces johnsonii F0510 TaxID=1227262 RepID=U1R7M0_9ACTO|nr:hypothetical protein HMPREF1549_03445 [Actinomyces johnsonii F0510]
MILRLIRRRRYRRSKPRASGDDPAAEWMKSRIMKVNPARAGMIRRAPGW